MRALFAAISLVTAAACRPSRTEDSRPVSVHVPVPDPSTAAEAASSSSAASSAPAPLPDLPTDWCGGEWRGLEEGACYWLPDAPEAGSRPPRLLVYLPGIVPPTPTSPQKERVQRIVIAAARRAGVVALLPRGRRGVGPADARDWWAWPTSPADVAANSAALIAEWQAARAKLEAIVGQRFARVYLAGSSSGAYFLTTVALHGDVDMDGYAAASGGAIAPVSPKAPKRPFYVGWASGDPTSSAPKALATFLGSAGWPTRAREHPGGHGAREEYLDEAFAFWATFGSAQAE